jgi:formylglycine-generating enzyme required for sulfatase activity
LGSAQGDIVKHSLPQYRIEQDNCSVASQTKHHSRDNNGDGLVDGSKRIRLATEQGPLTLRNWRGESRLASTKRWEVEKAVADGTGFNVLLKGHGPRRRRFKVLEVNASGVINGNSGRLPRRKALIQGWESVFGDVIKADGVIGRSTKPDANDDGLFDQGQDRAYGILAGSDEIVTLRSKSGEPLSKNTSNRWDAVQALSVEDGFQVLLQKGSRRKPEFKLLNVGADGITTDKSAWFSQAEALFAGWDARFNSSIVSSENSGNGVAAASVSDQQLMYVSPDGNDSNPGTLELPLATITYASSIAQPGDHIKLRGGIYRERVLIDNIHGTEEEPITISNYDDEKVVLEGAKDIEGEWVNYEGNIWKTTVDFDVTQLFVDDAMLIGARWPNINKHWDEYDESDGDNPTPGSYWDLGTRSHADRIGDEGALKNHFINQDESHSLSDLNVSVEGGVVVVHGVGPKVLDITAHTAGESTFEISSGAEDMNLLENYYITADLDLLDSEREWFYDKQTKDLYVWLEDNANPNQASIKARGYTQQEHQTDSDRILKVYDSSHIKFDGITVQTGSFHLQGSHNLTFENSKFLYSGHHKQMLGADINKAEGDYENYINVNGNETGGPAGLQDRNGDASLTWRRSEFANSYSLLLYHGRGGSNYLVEDSYFHNKPHGGGMLWSAGVNDGNVVRHSTFHTGGWGGLGKFGNRKAQQGGQSLAEFNRVYDFFFHGDDSGIQVNRGNVMGTTLRNNWIHDMPGRNGIRFDGDAAGMGGTVQNNVLTGSKRGTRLKGDLHTVVNNTAFGNSHIDINVSHDKFYGFTEGYDPAVDGIIRPTAENNYFNVYDYRAEGRRGSAEKQGNKHSIAVNNAGNQDFYPSEYKTPGIYQANSTTRSRSNVLQSELRDPENFDFRLKSGSQLIDAGVRHSDITDGFLGYAPDIGAYEFGDLNYWIPGHRTEKARTPIPADLSPRARPTSDLMWLGGIDAIQHRIYLGNDPNNLELKSEQTNNIYTPDNPFVPGEIYYWRVDSVKDDGEVVTGDVWEFSIPLGQDKAIPIEMVHVGDAGNQANFDGYGKVPYEYYISKYEITNEQYAIFLNETAKVSSQDGLTDRYHESMRIDRQKINNEYVYTVENGYEQHPVNYVDFRSALRFCNWLTSGNIKRGTYNSIWGSNNGINKRSWNEMEIGAVALPTEDEWYKAAYFSGQPVPGDWTNQAPSGWSLSNGDKHGQPVSEDSQNAETTDEFDGWTFHKIKSWSRNRSHRRIRSHFGRGEGTIAVIDPYEFASEADGVTTQSEISTPRIDISDAAAGQLKLSFDSSWPKHTADYASVLISYDDADPVPVFAGKASPQNKWGINARKTVNLNNPEGAQSAVVTWSYENDSNFWAIDNILVSDEQDVEYFVEDFEGLELKPYQSSTLPKGDQAYFSNAIQDGDLSRWPTGNHSDGPPDPVGSHDSPSYYGTYDQAGSLKEWLEADNSINSNSTRVRGGWYAANKNAYFTASAPENAVNKKRRSDDIYTGFRVVSLYPITSEPEGLKNQRPSWIAAQWSLGHAVVGNLFSSPLSEEVFDADNDVNDLTFTLLSGPAWLSIDSQGNINGQPTSTDLGLNEVMLRVTDPDGEYSDTEFPVKLNVNPPGGTTEPVENPVTEPVSEPVEEPVTEPVPEPVEEPVTEPVPEPVEEPVTEPVPEPVEEPVTEPVPEPVEEPVTEPVPEPVEEPVTEPVPEPVEEPVTEPVPEPVEEPVTEPVPEPVEEPVSQPVVDTFKMIGSGLFGPKNADLITNFDPASQRLEIDAQSFGAESDASFAISGAKRWKAAARLDADFVYHQRSGGLYFNANGSAKRWGNGGLFSVLVEKPVLTTDIVDVV